MNRDGIIGNNKKNCIITITNIPVLFYFSDGKFNLLDGDRIATLVRKIFTFAI